jgi:hypothetical protein
MQICTNSKQSIYIRPNKLVFLTILEMVRNTLHLKTKKAQQIKTYTYMQIEK